MEFFFTLRLFFMLVRNSPCCGFKWRPENMWAPQKIRRRKNTDSTFRYARVGLTVCARAFRFVARILRGNIWISRHDFVRGKCLFAPLKRPRGLTFSQDVPLHKMYSFHLLFIVIPTPPLNPHSSPPIATPSPPKKSRVCSELRWSPFCFVSW